jgi:hypothetical protein
MVSINLRKTSIIQRRVRNKTEYACGISTGEEENSPKNIERAGNKP